MNDLVLNQKTVNGGVITLKDVTDLISVEHNKAMKVVEKLCLESSFGTVEKIATVYTRNYKTNQIYLTNLTKLYIKLSTNIIKEFKLKKEKVWKHLRVEDSTHKRVKALAVFKSMNIDEVINYLVDKESKKTDDRIIDYKKKG